ncbi:biotin/lipoyl-containing protein, partial [Arthrobacter sp.]|uniref:biotin/lipoyl-containing protein n=1 Tax=Arthrobacter sp. TaxID=1667 RepID=UPI0028A06C85
MTEKTFNLPDVGEGLTEAEIVQWKVKEGDTVAINDVIVEIETAKSLVELPSPFAGTVTGLLVEEGQTVEVGTPIFQVGSGAPQQAASTPSDAPSEEAAPSAGSDGPPASSLTGSGPKADAVRRRPRRAGVRPTAPAP